MAFICVNGNYLQSDQPVLHHDNRGYRYGDGFFETIRLAEGRIPLLQYHLQRIRRSFEQLQFPALSAPPESILEEAIRLAAQNNCLASARIRLSFSSGRGSIFDAAGPTEYILEAHPLPPARNYDLSGLSAGICPLIKKSVDVYANLKSANYLYASVAARYAKQQLWNEVFILNHDNRIAEASVANIFSVKGDKVFTPPLSEGCVDGVMRAYLIDRFRDHQISLEEAPCTEAQLMEADEIFVTNAISGIRWIKLCNGKTYGNLFSKSIYDRYVAPLWRDS